MRIVACTLLGTALLGARVAHAQEGPAAGGADERPGAASTDKVDTPAEKDAIKAKPQEAPLTVAPGELPPFTIPRKYLPTVQIHGGAYIWFSQPVTTVYVPQHGADPAKFTPEDRFVELYLASLELDARLEDFGVYINPRFRDSKARKFYNSNVWVQQAYAYYTHDFITVKAGKIENAFSRMWDDTFYANIPYFDGIKLDMDYGVSVEGTVESKAGLGLAYYAQYAYIDGQTNGSLDYRDTLWVRCQEPGAAVSNVDGQPSLQAGRRKHITTARLEPSYRFSPKVSLRFGAFGQYMQASLPSLDAAGKCSTNTGNVFRYGADMSLAAGPVKIFGEFIGQYGKTTLDYPKWQGPPDPNNGGKPNPVGSSSGNNFYGLGGAEIQIWRFIPRYAISVVSYHDADVLEILQVPGLTINLHDNVQLMLEYAYWPRYDSGKPFYNGSNFIDQSFNAIVYGKF